ncbi:hypothetical protein CO661_17215 [Sinorhizobium fredii]|uniref:Uncharacterized protein n=1 Tax=Rhizobium fredii TaxID=380 RepID=A0A2A6LWG8_RHIFR|nr:hypothetical protein [Sinorhizobium fredii]PDT46650.1 hypothetical protein CO661_17215 [Sinorhizobium fredii]
MSDERISGNARTDPVLYVHWCEQPGCEKWGGFGFAVGRSEPKWFCYEHRPEWKSSDEARPQH